MRKLLSFVLIVGLVAMVAGCAQTPEVKSSTAKPADMTIRGTVYGVNQAGVQGNPLDGVVLILSGQSVSRNTVTDANGEYSFTGLPEGRYIVVATKEGYQRNVGTTITLGQVALVPTSDKTEVVNNINMANQPVVLSISPEPGATVEASALTITVVFNEAMDPASVRPALTCQGIRAFAIADTQNLTTSWSSDNKTLTITTGALLLNQTYRLAVTPGNIAEDTEGNLIDNTGGTTNAGGLSQTIYNNSASSSSLDYRTASGGAPGTPTGLLLSVNGKARGNIDYNDVILGTEQVNLSWLAPSSGQISGYRVYVSTGSSGPWSLLGSATGNAFGSTVSVVNTRLYGGSYDPTCIKHMAFVTDTVYFRAVAWNPEGESTGVATSERDAVEPGVFAVARQNPSNVTALSVAGIDASLTDYSAAANLDMGCYITFTEPMDVSTLTDATKYTPTVGSVTSATVVFNSGGSTVVELVFSVANPPANTVTVSGSGPADLSGNTVDITTPANIAAIVI